MKTHINLERNQYGGSSKCSREMELKGFVQKYFDVTIKVIYPYNVLGTITGT